MFSIVVVSHSKKLAEGVAEVAKMMARDVTIVAAGGTEDGSLGTSYEKIATAIDKAYTDDGVALFMDMGSAVIDLCYHCLLWTIAMSGSQLPLILFSF